ncbi:MAG: HIT family protein [Bacteroidetes bacterium]|nr:HIT family protein [Bacteroidota bacterium]
MNQTVPCPFCTLPSNRAMIAKSVMAYAIFDKFPVSKGHALVIPARHCANYFDLTLEEQTDCLVLLNEVKAILQKQFNPDGFNVGINIHAAAGQTVPHAHIHLIPRYQGDVQQPRGGVRGVIPGKQSY